MNIATLVNSVFQYYYFKLFKSQETIWRILTRIAMFIRKKC